MAALGVIPKLAVEELPAENRARRSLAARSRRRVCRLDRAGGRPDHLIVYSIAVEPAQQGKGDARILLEFSEQQAVAGGRSELRLYTNTRMDRNIAICRHCGFVETGERPHPSRAGQELVDMVKRIAIPPASS
jgi:GNAT superfamily N-acetyltransferase